jgi:uncharacterized membrane protein
MNTANYLAEIWGISLVIIPLALLAKEKHLKTLFNEIENDASLFLWGMISLILGLAMVLSFNVWEQSWQVIITILGWLALLKGLCLLFTPEIFKKYTKKIEGQNWLPIALVVIIFIGLVITYFGFTA